MTLVVCTLSNTLTAHYSKAHLRQATRTFSRIQDGNAALLGALMVQRNPNLHGHPPCLLQVNAGSPNQSRNRMKACTLRADAPCGAARKRSAARTSGAMRTAGAAS